MEVALRLGGRIRPTYFKGFPHLYILHDDKNLEVEVKFTSTVLLPTLKSQVIVTSHEI